MKVYKQVFPKMGGYLTNKNMIHLPRLEMFIQELARREPLYFQQRAIEDDEREFASEYKSHYYKVWAR
jgi:5'-3' exonuclease